MPYRKFGGEDVEPITFDVGPRSFRAVSRAPAGVLLDAAAAANLPIEQQTKLMMELLDDLLEPESSEAFLAGLRDRENPITIRDLIDIFQWLVTQYTDGRPTQASSSSESGPTPAGLNSTDASSETEPIS